MSKERSYMDRYEKQLEAVERETRSVLAKAREITASAATAGRGITSAEEKTIQGHLKAVEVLKEKRQEIQGAIETRQRVEDAGKSLLVGDDGDESIKSAPVHRKAVSLGEAFVKSDGYKALRERGFSGSWSTGTLEFEGKALLDSTGVGSLADGLLQAQIQPGIVGTLFQPLTVANLMAQGSTSSSLVRYMQETTATNGAGGVAEGGSKPESALVFNATDEPVKKIASVALLAA